MNNCQHQVLRHKCPRLRRRYIAAVSDPLSARIPHHVAPRCRTCCRRTSAVVTGWLPSVSSPSPRPPDRVRGRARTRSGRVCLAAFRRLLTGGSRRDPSGRRAVPIIGTHHVPPPGCEPAGARTAKPTHSRAVGQARPSRDRTEPDPVVGHHPVSGSEALDVFLPIHVARRFQPIRGRANGRRTEAIGAGHTAHRAKLSDAGYRTANADLAFGQRGIHDQRLHYAAPRRPRGDPFAQPPSGQRRQPLLRAGVQVSEEPPRLPRAVRRHRGLDILCRSFFPWYSTEHRYARTTMFTVRDVQYGRPCRVPQQPERKGCLPWNRHPARFVNGTSKPRPFLREAWFNPQHAATTLGFDQQIPAEGISMSLTGSKIRWLRTIVVNSKVAFRRTYDAMRYILLAAVTLLCACIPFQASASPTVVGLQAENEEGTASIYTDTANQNLLWITPPMHGRLKITQKSLAIDKPTCQSVASLYRTRRSMRAQLETYNEQLESIQAAISGLIHAAKENPDSIANHFDQMSHWEDLLESVTARRDKTKELVDSDTVAPHLLTGAGYYGFVATSGWKSALASVKRRNPDKVVNPINTSATQLNVSVVGTDEFKSNELISSVHMKHVDSLSSVSEEFQVDVEPTKIGACFIAFPQVVVGQADPYAFGMSINYEHPFALSTTVDATYNLKDVYDLLVQSGRSRGFFSKKSYRNTVESRALTEAFNLHIAFDQDVTEEQKRAEENRVKEFLLGYAVSQMTNEAAELGTPGKSGALVASEELMKACGLNIYCQGVAAALKVLDGIFASSRSTTSIAQALSIRKRYNSIVTETITIPRTISYTY